MEVFAIVSGRLAAAFLLYLAVAAPYAAAGPGESTKPLEERMEYARQTERKARAIQDSSMLAEAFYLWGKAYSFGGDYVTSQRYYLQSLRIQEALKDSSMIARLCVRLSENERNQQHLDQAMQYARKAVEVSTRIRAKQRMQIAYVTLGELYEALWESASGKNEALFDSAYSCYRTTEALLKEEPSLPGIADVDRLLGTLFFKKGDDRTFHYLERALHFFEEDNMYGDVVRIKILLGLAHLRAGRPKAAFNMLQNAKDLYQQTGLKEIPALFILEEGFIEYYQKTGRPDSAMAHMEYLYGLKEAQFVADRSKVLEWLNTEHEMQQKEKELEAHQRQLVLQARNMELQSVFILLLSVATVLGIILAVVFSRLSRRNRLMSEHNARLVSEQSHRVKNHLQMVASLLDLQSYEVEDPAAREVIADSRLRVDAVALLQRLLFNAEAGSDVLLPDYVFQLVSSVFSVYNLAGIRKKIEIEDVTLPADKAVPLGLILTELLTNACKYAFSGRASPELMIRCSADGRRLSLVMADNGPGFEFTGEKGTFGMQLIRIQAEQLYASYSFQKDPETGGARFEMEFSV